MFHFLRFFKVSVSDFLSIRAWPFRPLLRPFLSGLAEPQPTSVSQMSFLLAPLLSSTLRTFFSRFLYCLMLGAYGCRATASKCFLILRAFRNFFMNLCGRSFFFFWLPERPARIVFARLSALLIALSAA